MFKLSLHINSIDLKIVLAIIVGVYIYFRKNLKFSLFISIGLSIFLFINKVFDVSSGYRSLLLAIILSAIFAISFKEVFDYDKRGVYGYQLLKLDKFDYVFFIVVILVWFVAISKFVR